MKFSVNVDNGLFNLNGQQINLDHLGQNHTGYDTTKRQPGMMSFGKPITGLSAWGLWSLSALFQFLGGAWCFAVTVAESPQVAIPMQTPYTHRRLGSMN